MTEVRKHKRQTASGKTTTVRHHTRNAGGGQGDDAERARSAWQDRASAPHYSTLPPAAPPAADESFWDEDSREPEGEWWAEGEPGPEPEMSDAFRAMVEQNPDIARGYKKLSALRGAGYEGPVDQDGNPTSRRALFSARYKAAGEQEEAQRRFMNSKTIPERDAADRDYKAAGDKLKALPGPLEKLGE